MTTALNIIEGAAKLLGVLNKGENMPADDAADGLIALNDMLSSWANDSLLVYTRTIEQFSLVAGTAAYSIGSGQTWNTTKPVRILNAVIRDSANLDYPVMVIEDEDYQNIAYKTAPSPLPQYLNYNNGHPYGTVTFYGTPSVANSVRLLTEKPLTAFALTSTTVDLPAGWNKALKFNLALDLAPEYGAKVDELVLKGAMESKGAIKAAALKQRPIAAPNGGPRGNIYNSWNQ